MGEGGIRLWQQQVTLYRNGPGAMLWALVDETFLQRQRPWPDTLLSDIDRFQAYLDLANLLLAERERPFLPGQLVVAEDIAQKAFDIATKVQQQDSSFLLHLLDARIALARRKLLEALKTATKCLEEAKTPDQQARALVILSEAEVANSDWQKALDTLRFAYSFINLMLKSDWLPKAIAATIVVAARIVRLNLIEQLLNSAQWRDAVPLLKEAHAERSHDPAILAMAARTAFKQAHYSTT
jgi:hypothetical protein